MSTLRTFLQAVNSGQTNITRVLTLLMQYPAQWQGSMADIEVSPNLSLFLNAQFGAAGRMIPQEIAHIENHWPMPQKEALLTELLRAIEVGRPMVFKWTLTSANDPATDVVWPPDNTPLDVPVHVTFRSPRAGVRYSDKFQGSDDEVIVEV
jgi:hypothetical protein